MLHDLEVSAMEGYGQYCPLAKGAEVFAERWTPLILRELLRGSTTFNDLHRGVPRMSRSLLSMRLKKLESCRVLERRIRSTGTHYELTPAGRELGRVVTQLGTWAQRWYRSAFRGAELDVGVLMWDIRCTVDANALAAIRTVVQFIFWTCRPAPAPGGSSTRVAKWTFALSTQATSPNCRFARRCEP
jgi:DNA-binding HxlR family transcriptional regulator